MCDVLVSALPALDRLFTPADEAIETLRARRRDRDLHDAVCAFLKHDIPPELEADTPVFYLPRHLATPSFETIFAIEFARQNGAKLVLGQDKGGKFVGQNELKHPLGKLPFVIGKDRNGNDIIRNKTVIDFSESQGKPLSDIVTVFGLGLPDLHGYLLESYKKETLCVVDETGWIDRHARNDIAKQYQRMLAYSCVHSVMLEWFTPPEHSFVWKIVLPAFEAVAQEIGVRPLVIQLMDPERDSDRNWNAYPFEVLSRIEALERASTTASE